MKQIWRSIVAFWQEYRVEIKRYGLALIFFLLALRSDRNLLALVIFLGTLVMLWATTWGEKYRVIGEEAMERRKQARKAEAESPEAPAVDEEKKI